MQRPIEDKAAVDTHVCFSTSRYGLPLTAAMAFVEEMKAWGTVCSVHVAALVRSTYNGDMYA